MPLLTNALIQSAIKGDIEAIATFLNQQGDIEATDVAEYTLLHYAIKHHQNRLVLFLLKNKANPNGNHKSVSPYYLASKSTNFEALQLLIDYKVDCDLPECKEAVRLLLKTFVQQQINYDLSQPQTVPALGKLERPEPSLPIQIPKKLTTFDKPSASTSDEDTPESELSASVSDEEETGQNENLVHTRL